MVKIKLFGKSKGCMLCDGWKRKLTAMKLEFEFFDITQVQGLADMAWNNVGRIPCLMIGEWKREEVSPADVTSDEILKIISEQEKNETAK